MMGEDALKLRAEDVEDLSIIAACVQDAVVAVGEMTYLADEARFAAVLDRFTWEKVGGRRRKSGLQRVRAGLCFEGVRSVRRRGVDPEDMDRCLELLTITAAPGSPDGMAITLVFAGDATVRLNADSISCQLEDLGQGRRAPVRPRHPSAGI